MTIDLSYTAVAPLLPSLTSDLDLTHAMGGLLIGLYGIGMLIGSYPALRLAAWLGLVPATIVGLGLVVIGPLTFAFSSSFDVLCLGRFCGGFGDAITMTSILAIASTAGGRERRGAAIGMVYSGAFTGGMLGPLIGSAAEAFGRTIIFGLLALVQLVIAGFVTRLPTLPPGPVAGLRTTLGYLRSGRALIALSITSIPPFGLGIFVVSGSYRISESGGSSLMIAIAFSGMAGLYVVTSPTLGRISDERGRRQPIIALLLLAVFPLVLLALTTQPLPTVALIIIGGTLFTLVGGPGFALFSDLILERGGTTVEASFLKNLNWGLSAALGSIIAGLFHGAAGAEASFLFLAALLMVSASVVARSTR